MEAFRSIRKLLFSCGFTFSLFFSYICGLRDAGILDDLGRSNYKDPQAHLLEDNLVRFFSPGKWTRQ